MTWQDFVFTFGAWFFVAALVPVIFAKDKPPLFTSLSTGSILGVYAIALWSLDLTLAAVSEVALTAAWFLLAIQKRIKE